MPASTIGASILSGLKFKDEREAKERQRAEQDRQLAQQQQLQDLTGAATTGGLGSEGFKNLAAFSPSQANSLKNALKTDDQGLDAAFEDAAIFRSQMQADPTGQRAVAFLQDRVEAGQSQGRDMFLTQGLLQTALQSPEQALVEVKSFLDIPNQLGGKRAGKPLQKGQEGLVFDPNKGSFSIDPAFAQNRKELNKIAIDQKRELNKLTKESELSKARVKGQTEREKLDITEGINAAQSVGLLKRAEKLLDLTETGSFESAKLWGSRVLNLKGKDVQNREELDNLLGKSIVKQLKPTFGGSFSVNEGQWLKDMEANFGKSTAGNKILVKRGLALVNETAKIGLDAATSAEDVRSAGVIQGWIDFQVGGPDEQAPTVETGQQAPGVLGGLSDDELFN